MTIQQLEYILAVDTYRNFAKAAENCFVTQPTLSMQIKKLEDLWGVMLFDRSKKPVITTSIGKRIIEQARSGLMDLKKINDIIEDNAENISGSLRIGIIPTISPYLLPRLIPSFVQKFPEINLGIDELISEQIIDHLKKDLLDVGILVAPEDKEIKNTPLYYEKFLLYFSEGKTTLPPEITLEELDLSEMWLLKEGHCFRDQIEALCGKRIEGNAEMNLQFKSGSLETLKNMVDNHFGYTLLPELALLDLRDQKERIRHFKNIDPMRQVDLCFHRSFLKERLIKTLAEEIKACVPKGMLEHQRGNIIPWK